MDQDIKRAASTIPRVDVASSRISQMGHDPETNTLVIQFKRTAGGVGPIYHYANFTAEDYEKLIGAESIGSHFERHIRANADRHPYTRMAEENVDQAVDAD